VTVASSVSVREEQFSPGLFDLAVLRWDYFFLLDHKFLRSMNTFVSSLVIVSSVVPLLFNTIAPELIRL
jgi:hypothetical protein